MERIRVYNGMPSTELGTEGWHKPWSGGNGGECVEVMQLGDGRVALRQSTDPEGPALIYTRREIESFISAAKAGAADFLLNAGACECTDRPDRRPDLITRADRQPGLVTTD